VAILGIDERVALGTQFSYSFADASMDNIKTSVKKCSNPIPH
jgi:hypothetical protein